MARKTAILTAVFAAILTAGVLLLFEVSVNLRFALPGQTLQAEPEQEALYRQCYADKDAEIHRVAFGTIDNPDVQKEFISTNRAIASGECRTVYPRVMLPVKTPFEFNVIDFKARYW